MLGMQQNTESTNQTTPPKAPSNTTEVVSNVIPIMV
jgi:hypothetical protein